MMVDVNQSDGLGEETKFFMPRCNNIRMLLLGLDQIDLLFAPRHGNRELRLLL
jgi:hypothetical protein